MGEPICRNKLGSIYLICGLSLVLAFAAKTMHESAPFVTKQNIQNCTANSDCDLNACTFGACKLGACVSFPADGDPCVADGQTGVCSDRDCVPSSASPVEFSAEEATLLADSFFYENQTRPGYKQTRCPDSSVWMEEMRRASPSPNKTIVNFGCNKGFDALYFLIMWDDTSSPFNRSEWFEMNEKQQRGMNCACANCTDLGIPPLRDSDHSELSPLLFCIEPLPDNVDLLNTSAMWLGYDQPHGGHHPTAMYILPYAGSDKDGILQFPKGGGKGTEHLGLARSAGPGTVPVKAVTVDSLVESYNIERVDILTIDTEGHDPAVLYGAPNALVHVRYLEFEAHKRGLWASTKLTDVISYLDELGFDCSWAGTKQIWPITGAWDDRYGKFKDWSNVVCVKRGDIWHEILYQYVAQAEEILKMYIKE